MTQPTDRQILLLQSPIDTGRVQHLKNFSHLEAWDVRRYLTRVFGFTGWGIQTMELTCVATNSVQNGDRWKHTVVYRAQVRLTVKDTAGNVIGQWDDGASGDAINLPSLGDAHDFAMKTALSQALKRCAVNLGDQFGLSLYNDGDTRPVVNWSVAYPKADPGKPDPPVKPEPTMDPAQWVDPVAGGALSPDPLPGPLADTPRSVMAEAETRAMRPDSELSDAELEYAAANGPGDVAAQALAEMERRRQLVQNRPEPSRTVQELPAAYAEMCATAARIGFSDDLPAQFLSSFGVDIMHGTVEQYREATRIMNGEQP
jgi:hypothetical protein